MAPRVETPSMEADHLNLIPGSHRMEGETATPQSRPLTFTVRATSQDTQIKVTKVLQENTS